MPISLSRDVLADTVRLFNANDRNCAKAARAAGLSRGTFHSRLAEAKRAGLDGRPAAPGDDPPPAYQREKVTLDVNEGGGGATLSSLSPSIRTLEGALAAANVDLDVWEVERWTANKWDMGSKFRDQDLTFDAGVMTGHAKRTNQFLTHELWQVKVILKRRTPQATATAALLKEIQTSGVQLPVYRRPKPRKSQPRRALEINILDPHMGLHCYQPSSDNTWSFDECEQAFMATTERLIDLAAKDGPFEKVMCAFGNDFLHADTPTSTTTHGTPQPEAATQKEMYLRGEKLALWYAERLRQIAPLELYGIWGNHDEVTTFTLARLIRAYYMGAKATDVTVNAEPSPYKFWSYGVNLIGLEHGCKINAVRLAAIMANETRRGAWRDARYCEWHLGDQHRKGSSKPSTFEEQGVSVEYLPGLTPANEWHKSRGYNWQKRGGFAFVYDHDAGPIARYQVNFDSYTGKHMGT